MREIQKIENLPIIVLTALGHVGVDYFGNLFYSSKEVLKVPALSFFRKLEILLKNKKINIHKVPNKKLFNIIKNNFMWKSPIKSYNYFSSKKDEKDFRKFFCLFIKKSKIHDVKKKIFLAIHYGMAKIKKKKINNLKYILTHEHQSRYCKEYKKFFFTKFVIVVRDPRAAFAGSFKGAQIKNVSKEFMLDRCLTFWKTGFDFYLKEKKEENIFLVQNEKFQGQKKLKIILKKICKWLDINFSKEMLQPKYFNEIWHGDSSYLSKYERKKPLPKSYYNKKNVTQRWKSQISKSEINDIENILSKSMKIFKYKPINKISFISKLNAYKNIFFKYKKERNPLINTYYIIKNIIRRTFILHKTNLALKIFDLT